MEVNESTGWLGSIKPGMLTEYEYSVMPITSSARMFDVFISPALLCVTNFCLKLAEMKVKHP